MQIQDIETQIILIHLIFLENKDAKPINYHSNLLIRKTNTSSSIYRIFVQLFHLKSLCFCAFLQRNSEKQKTVIELLRQTLLFKPKISLTKTSTNATNNINNINIIQYKLRLRTILLQKLLSTHRSRSGTEVGQLNR